MSEKQEVTSSLTACEQYAKELEINDPTFMAALVVEMQRGVAHNVIEQSCADICKFIHDTNELPTNKKIAWITALLLSADALDTKERAVAVLANPQKFVLEYEQGDPDITLGITHWAAKIFAASFAASLKNAKNFVTMDLVHPDGVIIVTIRRKEGKTPAEVLTELRAEIAQLNTELQQYRKQQ